jgi:hypothetical protein
MVIAMRSIFRSLHRPLTALLAIVAMAGLLVAAPAAAAGRGGFHGGGHAAGAGHWRGGHGHGYCCGGWGWGAFGVGLGWGLGWYDWWWPNYGPYYGTDYVVAPPLTVTQPAMTAPSYYYCANPKGYYPTVQVCQQPWQAVPITPQ